MGGVWILFFWNNAADLKRLGVPMFVSQGCPIVKPRNPGKPRLTSSMMMTIRGRNATNPRSFS